MFLCLRVLAAKPQEASVSSIFSTWLYRSSVPKLCAYFQSYQQNRGIKILIWKWVIAVIDATFAVVKRKQRSRVWIPYKPEFYSFRLSFRNCKSIIASITAMIYFHIILQPAVHIYDFHIFVYSNFNKNTLIQLIFLCCYILVHVHEV